MLPLNGHLKTQRKLARRLGIILEKLAPKLTGRAMRHLGKDVDDGDDSVTDDWADVIPLFEGPLGAIGANAGDRALVQLGLDDELLTDQVADTAKEYARARAAEMIGKRWVGEELVDNPDARWSISDYTRTTLNDMLATGVMDGLAPDELADKLRDSYLFSQERAMTIARTELAMAHVQGNLAAWDKSGQVDGKESLLSPGHDEEDECDQAAQDGVIPAGEAFSTGDDGPPYHPNCECDLLAVLTDEGAH